MSDLSTRYCVVGGAAAGMMLGYLMDVLWPRMSKRPKRSGADIWADCIGDAAHAMSPIGGVGINLAI